MYAVERAAIAANGKIINPVGVALDKSYPLGTMNFDTRSLVTGEVFVALPGEVRDGHEFIENALEKKISGLIVSEAGWSKLSTPLKKRAMAETWVIECADTLQSMGLLANAWRKEFAIPVFAVTGSNGKTTTKDMLGSVLNQLAQDGKNFLFSQGSFNNNIGVPRTLSFLNESHEGIVLEVGTNHFGELEYLAKIAEPNAAVITNIGDSHLEFLRDRRGVLRAKWELIDGLVGKNKTWYVNRDDPILRRVEVEQHKGLRKVSYSRRESQADFYAGVVDKLGIEGNFGYRVRFSGRKISEEVEAEINVPGLHNVQNALAAFAVAVDYFGKSPSAVAEAFKNVHLSKYRSEIIALENGAVIFNDCYNANPSSMEAALKMVADASEGRFMAALGELLEVGGYPEEVHFHVGQMAAKTGVKILGASGPHAEDTIRGAISAGMHPSNLCAVDEPEKLQKFFHDKFGRYHFLLVKGSRGAKMEELVEKLKVSPKM